MPLNRSPWLGHSAAMTWEDISMQTAASASSVSLWIDGRLFLYFSGLRFFCRGLRVCPVHGWRAPSRFGRCKHSKQRQETSVTRRISVTVAHVQDWIKMSLVTLSLCQVWHELESVSVNCFPGERMRWESESHCSSSALIQWEKMGREWRVLLFVWPFVSCKTRRKSD